MGNKSTRIALTAGVLVLMLALVLALVPGCGGGEEATTETITIIDQTNKAVEIPKNVNRIVTLPIPFPAVFYAVAGSGEKIVGIHPTSMSAVESSILGVMAPELKNASTAFVKTKFEVNVEELLKLKPDVVVQWAWMDKEIEKMEAVGIPVIGITYGSQEDLNGWIRIIGQMLGMEDKAAELLAYHHDTIDEISAITEDIPMENRPKSLYFYDETIRTTGEGTYNDFWIETTGGINVADEIQGWGNVNMEQVLAWNPDFIYVGNFAPLQPEDLLENKIEGQDWSVVEAVKKGQVYKIPLGGYRWDPPNAESPLMLRWLAVKHHPDLFDYNIEQEIRNFCSRFYGYDVSDEEIKEILQPGFSGIFE